MSADEFAWLPEIAQGLPGASRVPAVVRVDRMVDGRTVSALRWDDQQQPEVVLLHGSGQNAHTWDPMLLALGRPALAIDLPGHGHSDWRDEADYTPGTHARAVEEYLSAEVQEPYVLVGMSLGGHTAIRAAVSHPEQVRHVVVVDVTPQSGLRVAAMPSRDRAGMALLGDPGGYADFEDMVAAAAAAFPNRSLPSLRRGVWHNATQGDDGLWRWRADRRNAARDWQPIDHRAQWPVVDRLTVPTTLVLATRSGVVTAEDAEEFVRRAGDARVVHIDTEAHSVQSARPVELAHLVRSLLERTQS